MINWREKFLAFGIHFLATLLLGACAAALIFLVWFPDPFETMVGVHSTSRSLRRMEMLPSLAAAKPLA